MQIRIRQTGAVIYESEFRSLHSNISMPQQLTESLLDSMGADPVLEGAQASGGDQYQFSQAQGVEQINGKWFTKYVLGPTFIDHVVDGVTKTAAEQEAEYKAGKDAEQAKAVRTQRDQLLAATDWRYRRDLITSPEWDAYCQALRDVPSQSGFPWEVTWPVAP